MRSKNPMFNTKALEHVAVVGAPMTLNGAVGKTFMLTLLVVISAMISVNAILTGAIGQQLFMPVLVGSAIIGFILALITTFNPLKSNVFAPFYAVTEGVFVGLTSFFFESMFPGIVLQAVAGTFLVMFVMLILYQAKIIKVTETFKSTLTVAIIAIGVLYLINFIGIWVPFLNIPMISAPTHIGIAFSVIVCVVAALSLIVDFDRMEQGQRALQPKIFEWYYAFGLMVTLIWLYIEMLRLLYKLYAMFSSRE